MPAAEPAEFAVGPAPVLRGNAAGEGTPIVLCHGLTASRRYVVHGSRFLERADHRVITYDARGHGESDGASEAQSYGYPELIADLERVVDAEIDEEERFLLGGHSMGAHTAVGYALAHPERVSGLVIIGPTYTGEMVPETLEYWDGLAAALDVGGIGGFVEFLVRESEMAEEWRDSVARVSRERMERHRDLGAIVRALRETPASRPFGSLEDLAGLDVPALVVASGDEADPGHPYAVAEAYARALPRARLISEDEGQSPLAWQGGRLSREISLFALEPDVALCS
ncbi:MAG TPA: alpha/beta hydrolase [Solirubrobacterales bacterium]|jgi:pimeloyl-ACP methyl ester carboxylesterase|nr:alpha/beta hydrolase [Solirubrobacterales bacterium]